MNRLRPHFAKHSAQKPKVRLQSAIVADYRDDIISLIAVDGATLPEVAAAVRAEGEPVLDAGFEAARAVIERVYAEEFIGLDPAALGKDPKTRLQEWLQGRQLPRPLYRLVETRGDDHARIFLVSCETTEPAHAELAEAASLRAAEQQAAERLLAKLEKK